MKYQFTSTSLASQRTGFFFLCWSVENLKVGGERFSNKRSLHCHCHGHCHCLILTYLLRVEMFRYGKKYCYGSMEVKCLSLSCDWCGVWGRALPLWLLQVSTRVRHHQGIRQGELWRTRLLRSAGTMHWSLGLIYDITCRSHYLKEKFAHGKFNFAKMFQSVFYIPLLYLG